MDGDLVDHLAEVLTGCAAAINPTVIIGDRGARHLAATLLPVVQALIAKGAAAELEASAFGLDACADEQSGWCGPIHDFADGMRARAAALLVAVTDAPS